MPLEQVGHSKESSPDPTDVELYLALRKGHMAALGILYDRHAGLVYGLALKILGNSQEAEDLTQDIFLNLTRTGSYEPKRGSLRTYLAILTRSRAIDRVRSRNVAFKHSERWKPDRNEELTSDSPFEHVFQDERSQNVQVALAQLSDSQQQVLQLAYFEGLTQTEIAERLQIPLGTVKTRARQGLLKLRQALTDYLL
jgi:RNA polymerase sigma-70 factor (ECF subfamily)